LRHVQSAVRFAARITWGWPLQFTSEIRNKWSLIWRSKLPVVYLAKFEVLLAVLMTIHVFWDKLYRVIDDVSERHCAFILQGKTVKIKALHCFETSAASRYTVHPRKIKIFIFLSLLL
jgi:hypothetical protein